MKGKQMHVGGFVAMLMLAGAVGAQQQQGSAAPSAPALSPEASAALDDLSARYAVETPQIQGWFNDRPVLYYDFGVVREPVTVGRVLWPIHGFDARGNPVAIRGQRPIFSTLPGLEHYSGLWKLEYIVTADFVQPNTLRTLADVESFVRRRRATVRSTDLVLNLPIVPRGTRLTQDSTPGVVGWYEGREVQYFDFGYASTAPAPMWRFARAGDGEPMIVDGQNSILDSIPVAPAYPDLWDIRLVRVDSTYAANSIKSATALRNSRLPVDSDRMIRNLPVTVIDGIRVARTMSPIGEFADMRSPFPPAPTKTP